MVRIFSSLIFLLFSVGIFAAPKIIAIGEANWDPDDQISGINIILSSSDGINWQQEKVPDAFKDNMLTDIIYAENQFHMIGWNTQAISADAITWKINQIPLIRKLLRVNDKYFGLSYDYDAEDSGLFQSNDGIHFTEIMHDDETDYKKIVFNGKQYLLMFNSFGEFDTMRASFRSSLVGTKWAPMKTSCIHYAYNDLIYAKNRYIAVGSNLIISNDSKKWSYLSNPDWDNQLNSITYGNNMFVAVGNKGEIIYSTTGDDFTFVYPEPTTSNLKRVIWSDTIQAFVAVGDKGVILTSKDGKVWQQQVSTTTVDLVAVAG